tara:strand:- start:103 stop:552 length:450 start_codon:yes stop_codon:yes gene_type:complete
MQNQKNKIGIDALWKKYQHTLEQLADALERLEQRPKTVEQIVEVPVTEFVEVPKIVEVEVVKELTPEQKAFYENKISDLESQIAQLKSPNIDYWGRPKNISKKSIDDLTAEQKIEQRYQRLVEEVRAGKLDLQTLTHAEAEIVQKLINE